MSVESLLVLLVLLAGFASQGGRASVTYQPTSLKGDGQGCPSDEMKAQAIENFHSLIEERVETASTPQTRLITELNTAVETLSQEVAELANNSQTDNGTLTELSQEVAELANNIEMVSAVLQSDIQDTGFPSNLLSQGYTRVAYLNMTDPSHQCPAGWETYTTPKRTCGRNSNGGSCQSVFYPTNGVSYSRVCGRVIAYQYCTTDAFALYNLDPNNTIDDPYLDGISITHGNPKEHVWSFASAFGEINYGIHNCPCTNTYPNILIPPFVGDDYFCETGTTNFLSGGCTLATHFNSDDPLWDGEGCGPTSTCCEFNNPPWFCKTLPVSQPVTDDIEVRICADSASNFEDTPVELIELYVY